MDFKLEDLLDIPKLQKLLDSLNEALPFSSAILDNDGKVLMATAWQDVCTKFHRVHPECEKACRQSDQTILSHILDAVQKVPILTRAQLDRHLAIVRQIVETMGTMGLDRLKDKPASAVLWASEERFRLLYEQAPVGYQSLDAEGNFLSVNETWLAMLGYAREDVMGRWFGDFLAPGEQDRFRANLSKLKAAEEILGDEFQMVRKDGSTCLVSFNVKIGKDEAGNFKQAYSVLSDITERRKAEEALRESEDRYRALVQYAPVAIFVNRANKVVLANEACLRLFGATEVEQLLSKSPFELFHPDCHPGMRERIRRLRDLGEPVPSIEEKIIRLDGAEVDVEVAAAPFMDRGATAIHVVLLDITERKRMEKALETAKKLETIGMITGGVAHEVRNPLNAIQLMAAVLEKKQGNDPDVRQCVAHIQDQVQRLSLLMKDLLRLGRPADPAVFAPCNLLDLTRSAAEIAEAEIVGRAGRVQIRGDGLLPPVQGDAGKLTQVLVNLLQNALSLSRKDAPVEVEVSLEGGMATIRIRDQGPGIAKEFLPRLFQPFQSKRKGGTGLGLAIVQKIVLDHGGTITATNNDPPPGATFTVRLPVGGEVKG